MNAVIYARFSSDRQTELSIEAQVRACLEYAEKKGINIIRTYADEAITGTTNARPMYQAMLSDAFEGKFDLILIHKYDRIARSLEEQVSLRSRLKALNIRLIAVAQDYGEGKDADLTKGIQWVLGEYYSANLSEEVKKGHKEIALKGLHNGGVPPFGYDIINQRYVVNDLEAEFVRKMFNICISGGSYSGLIESMRNIGITGKRGKPIRYSQIYDILHNEKYTGVYLYCLSEEPLRAERRSKPNAIRIEGAIPAIISKEDFAKAQIILKSRKRQKSVKHRCSGLVHCECGAKMHLSRTKRKGHEYNNFRCSAKCGGRAASVNEIDEAVGIFLENIFSEANKEAIEDALRALDKYNKAEEKALKKAKKAKKEKLQQEISNIMNAMASGQFNDNYELCSKMLSDKQKELIAVENMCSNAVPSEAIKDWLEGIAKENYAPRLFIDKIIVKNDSIEIISNFDKVVGNLGCGGTIGIFPTTMFHLNIMSKAR